MLYILLDLCRGFLHDKGLYSFVRILDELQFRTLFAALLSFAIVLMFGRSTIAWLVKKKIGDAGLSDAQALQHHAASKANTPTMGGLLICGAIAGSVFLLADIRQFYVQLGMIVLVWLAALGGFDDYLKLTAKARGTGSRQGLYAWEKLVFQLGLGVIVGFFLYQQGTAGEDLRHVLNLPFQKTYVTGAGAIQSQNPNLIYLGFVPFVVLAMLILTGMSNAVNITDGMDGLAGGISAAVAGGLVILSFVAQDMSSAQFLLVPYIQGSQELPILAAAMAGACLGFLWWNCSPAQVFMGDTGALALGGLLGYIALVIRQEVVLFIMSGVFLWEIASVAMQVGYFKWTKGKRIFRMAPFHHHLHLGGWTEQQVVARSWIVTILLIVVALATIKIR